VVAASDSHADIIATSDYVCDGTDDDVQIQAAIDALPASGGTVELAAGSFVISSTVTLPDNTHLIISTGALVTLAAASNTDMFTNSDTVGGNENITVSGGGVIDGNGTNQVGADRDNFTFANVTRLTLRDFTTQNSLGWGLHTASDCSIVRVLDITAPGPSYRGGIQIDGDDCLAQNCIANDHTTNDGYGLWLAGDKMDVISCHASGNDDDNLVISGSEVRVVGGSFNNSVADKGCHVTAAATQVTIIGAEFRGNALDGIECSPGNVLLRGCHIVNNGRNGAWGDGDNTSFEGCLIEDNTQRGIRSFNGTPDGLRITNNTIRNNGQSGVELDNNTNCIITGNHIYDDQGTPTQDYAVKINNTNSGPVVVTNNLFGPQQTGEVLSNGSDDRIWGNNTTADDYVKIAAITRIALDVKTEYGDADVNVQSDDDGYFDIAANLGVRIASPGIQVSEDAWLGIGSSDDRFVFNGGSNLIDAATPLFRAWPDSGPGTLAIRRGDANGHLIRGGVTGPANGLELVTVGSGVGHSFYTEGTTLVAKMLAAALSIYKPTKIGDGGTTDYSEFEADGTLKFNGAATVWKDENLDSGRVQLPASSAPSIDTFTDENGADTDIACLAFSDGDKIGGTFELQHDYKEGSDFTFHIHFQNDAAPSGTDYVAWEIDYTVVRDGATMDAVTNIATGDLAVDTQYEQVRGNWAAITGTGFQIGDQISFKLARVTASGDAYAGDCKLKTVGIHYEVDTVGSRTISAK
jgi:parallel beta-helix repeat protein